MCVLTFSWVFSLHRKDGLTASELLSLACGQQCPCCGFLYLTPAFKRVCVCVCTHALRFSGLLECVHPEALDFGRLLCHAVYASTYAARCWLLWFSKMVAIIGNNVLGSVMVVGIFVFVCRA